MLEFLSSHADILNIAINTGMLLVWVVYLQLLLNGYRRQRSSSILITRGAGQGVAARCLITNMSREPIYVSSLIADLSDGERSCKVQLTDLRDLPDDLGTDPRSAMRQGSLDTGHYLDAGHFDALIQQLAEGSEEIAADDVQSFELTVLALYGPEYLPVGARRRFDVVRETPDRVRVVPASVVTHQIHGKRERRALMRELERFM